MTKRKQPLQNHNFVYVALDLWIEYFVFQNAHYVTDVPLCKLLITRSLNKHIVHLRSFCTNNNSSSIPLPFGKFAKSQV